MKIDQQNLQQTGGAGGAQQAGGSQQVTNGRGGSVTRSPYGFGSDSVELSSLSAAVRSYTTPSPDRASSLAQLGQVVQSGRYQVDARAVSQGLINDALLP
jgi:anti-sigma28 factor (negative regulator of flagellin synthesis)